MLVLCKTKKPKIWEMEVIMGISEAIVRVRFSKALLCSCAGIALIAVPGAAIAQQTPAEDTTASDSSGDIVVTALSLIHI